MKCIKVSNIILIATILYGGLLAFKIGYYSDHSYKVNKEVEEIYKFQ